MIHNTNMIENKKEMKDKEKKEKKIRCDFCNKKLGLIFFTCKCENHFCQKHLNPHSHDCSFNYKLECQEKLKENNPQMKSYTMVKV